MTKSNIEQHQELLNSIHQTYISKNRDYGDSFSKSFQEFGPTAGLVRMEDKFNRAKHLLLTQENPLVNDESVQDTLLDLANYSIMLVMSLRQEADQFKEYHEQSNQLLETKTSEEHEGYQPFQDDNGNALSTYVESNEYWNVFRDLFGGSDKRLQEVIIQNHFSIDQMKTLGAAAHEPNHELRCSAIRHSGYGKAIQDNMIGILCMANTFGIESRVYHE